MVRLLGILNITEDSFSDGGQFLAPDAARAQGEKLIAGGAPLKEAVTRILDAFSARPHIFNLGHGIQQDTPLAHVEELMALVKGGT